MPTLSAREIVGATASNNAGAAANSTLRMSHPLSRQRRSTLAMENRIK
jgi:hypothetical protein